MVRVLRVLRVLRMPGSTVGMSCSWRMPASLRIRPPTVECFLAHKQLLNALRPIDNLSKYDSPEVFLHANCVPAVRRRNPAMAPEMRGERLFPSWEDWHEVYRFF
jgi:hypothetical protein